MCKEIPLSREQVALVDSADYDWLTQYKWCLDHNGYVCRMVNEGDYRHRRKVLLHRFILDAPSHLQVDHINHCLLDNRRCNIRLVTREQNRANSRPNRNGTSRYKGVYWHKPTGRWYATINVSGGKQHIGSYASEADAAAAYNQKAAEAWGQYAYLNTIASP